MLGQAIGRWGNYFNEEAFGTPTALPWKLYISPSHRPLLYAQDDFFHPAFLYESLWDLGVFVLLVWVLRKRLERAPGALFLAYVGLYSLGRFLTEAIRTDPLMIGPLRVAQLVSLLGVGVAMVGIPLLLRRSRSPSGRVHFAFLGTSGAVPSLGRDNTSLVFVGAARPSWWTAAAAPSRSFSSPPWSP